MKLSYPLLAHVTHRDARTASMSAREEQKEDEQDSFDLADALQRASSEAEASSSAEDADPMKKVEAALACPCVADLRNSSCGKTFDEALTCYMLASDEEKGKKCVEQFVTLHACMVEHASEFEEFTEQLVEHQNVEGPAKVKAAA